MDTIVSMYENNFPIRFGVILYSAKLIMKIEENGGELPLTSAGKDDSHSVEDISSLVICWFDVNFFFPLIDHRMLIFFFYLRLFIIMGLIGIEVQFCTC